MNKLAYCIRQSGYAVEHGNNVIQQQLDGGPCRYRRDIRGNSHLVNSSWITRKKGYQYLVAFFNVWQRNPNQPFLASLIIDDAELQEYECFFKSGFRLDAKEGGIYTCSATLEVKAKLRNDAFDDTLVALGSDSNIFEPLEELVNVNLPNALGV